jgi:hypothetical protein
VGSTYQRGREKKGSGLASGPLLLGQIGLHGPFLLFSFFVSFSLFFSVFFIILYLLHFNTNSSQTKIESFLKFNRTLQNSEQHDFINK